jgi:acyl-coenzyme A thioesterase PaaI-like protein
VSDGAGLGGRLGIEPRADHSFLQPAPGLWRDGTLSPGVLLWLADWEACREAVAGDGTVLVATRELRLRVLHHVAVDGTTTVVARARTVRRSARNAVIEVRLQLGERGPLWAFATGSYVAGRWDGPPEGNPQITMSDPAVLARRPPILEPLADLLGAVPDPSRPGTVVIPPDPELQNPQGGLSGPVVGLALEAAIGAAAAAQPTGGGDGRGELSDLQVAFLAAGRQGPFVASAERLGPMTYRAELRDEGVGALLATGLGVVGYPPAV